jgi:uncharacterized protein YndB with AHSA1/START domain
MATVEHMVEIARPPADVFAWLTEPERVSRWQDTLAELRQISEGSVGEGTRLLEIRTYLGKRIESEVEVTAYEPERQFDLRTVSGPLPFHVSHTLEPTDGGTRLHARGVAEPGGLFRIADALVARQAKRQFRADFERLKELIEAGA